MRAYLPRVILTAERLRPIVELFLARRRRCLSCSATYSLQSLFISEN